MPRTNSLYNRFRGFFPVAVDLETGGVDVHQNPLLEIAVVFFQLEKNGLLVAKDSICEHIIPFAGSVIDKEALEINQIDPDYPLRFPKEEKEVLTYIFNQVQKRMKRENSRRAILVGHNAHFDLAFLNRAVKRCGLEKKNPFHSFSVIDTVSLAALAYGQTILSLACEKARLGFNADEAHSAIYDAQKTADLFCNIVNSWLFLGGWNEETGIKGHLNRKKIEKSKPK